MTTAKNLLAFMTDAPDGKYEAPKPSDDQLIAVLPWLIDQTVTWANKNGHCETVNAAIHNVVTNGKRWNGDVYYYNAAGLDCNGYNCEGRDAEGYDRHGRDAEGYGRDGYHQDTGLNRDGFNRYGFDRDGFNRDGHDQYGQTRQEAVAKLVGGWSKAKLDLVAAKLAEREAATAAAQAQAAVNGAEAALNEAAPVEELTAA